MRIQLGVELLAALVTLVRRGLGAASSADDERSAALEVRQRIQRDQVTGQALPNQPEDAETVVFARLAYPIPGRPASVTIGPGVRSP